MRATRRTKSRSVMMPATASPSSTIRALISVSDIRVTASSTVVAGVTLMMLE